MRLAVIPARGGSKRIPRKNIKLFAGKPIIAWAIEAARQSQCFDRIIVSTEDAEIATIAAEYGADVPFIRPVDLSGDYIGTTSVIAHAIEWQNAHGQQVTQACCIYPTSPFMRAEDLVRGLQTLESSGTEYTFSVTSYAYPIQRAIRVNIANRVSMVTPDYFKSRTQDLEPTWHDAAQFYWGRASAWLEERILFGPDSTTVVLPRQLVHDLDTMEDWIEAELFFDFYRQRLSKRKLAIGAAQFGLEYGIANSKGKMSTEGAEQIISVARLAQIDTLDTAIAYGDSEQVIGQIGSEDFKIVTKLPTVPTDCQDVQGWVQDQLNASLNRLGRKRIHGLLLHRPGQLLQEIGPELYRALRSVQSVGLVKKIGISIYETAELDAICPHYAFDLVQTPLNIIDRRLIDSGWAKRLTEAGVEIHSRSAFLQGLLLMPADQRPAKFAPWADIWDEWDRWLAETGLTPLQACLRYVCELTCISKVVVGLDSADQLHGILAALDRPLPSLPVFKPLKDSRLINPARWNEL